MALTNICIIALKLHKSIWFPQTLVIYSWHIFIFLKKGIKDFLKISLSKSKRKINNKGQTIHSKHIFDGIKQRWEKGNILISWWHKLDLFWTPNSL